MNAMFSLSGRMNDGAPVIEIRRRVGWGRVAMALGAAVTACWVLGANVALAIVFPPTATVPANALRFLGTSQYVEVPASGDFNLTGTMTIEAWVNVSAFDKANQAIVTKGDDWGLIRSGNSGTKVAFRTKSGSSANDLVSATSLTLNRWYHIAAVYDGTTKYLYIDGVLNASAAYNLPVNLNGAAVQFGANAEFQTQRLFKGMLDTVRVWSVARSAAEIGNDLDRDLWADVPGLLGDWRFNEPSGADALDSSAGQRHAVLKNMVQADRVDGIAFRPPPPVASVPKSALLFEGDDRQFVAVSAKQEPSFDLAAPNKLTVEAWVNVAAFDKPWQAIVTKGEAWGLVRNDQTSKVAFRTGTDALVGSLELLPNRWYHLAGVMTGTKKQLYIDGELAAEANYSTALAQNNVPVVVGSNGQILNRAFRGRIDSVRVWSEVRSASQIKDNMLADLRGSEFGLVADWRFNEGAGSQAIDHSYAERHAALVNLSDAFNRVDGLSFGQSPRPTATEATGALSFDGGPGSAVDRVEVGNESAFDLNDRMTIEAWVNVGAFDKPWQAIVTKGDAWGITRAGETSKIAFRTSLGFASSDLESAQSMSPGLWYHVAAVFDGAQKLLYIDGVLDNSVSFTGPLQKNDLPVLIGSDASTGDRGFKGVIENVRIWNVGRSADEILTHRDRILRGTEPGLLGEWKFDESSGTVAINGTGRTANDGAHLATPTRVNGLKLRPPLPGGLAVRFDQSGTTKQYARIPVAQEAQFDLPNQMSVETWVYFDELPVTDVALVSKGSTAWQVLLKPSGKIDFSTPGLVDSASAAATSLLSTATLPIKEWHHVAVTWNPGTKEKAIYVDGIKDASQTDLQGTLGSNALPVLLAAEPMTSTTQTAHFGGQLDEVRIWEMERSAARVLENFNRKVNGTEPLLVAVWGMDEATGTTVGNGTASTVLDGTLEAGMTSLNRVEGVALGEPLADQYALQFDGVNDYVQVPDSPDLNPSGTATFEAWIKPAGTGFRTILYKGADGYGLALDGSNNLRFFVSALNQNALSSSRPVVNDVWQHVAVVVNGAAGTTTFYIDGKPAGVHASAVLLVKPGNLVLGRQGATTGSNYYQGAMDEVRVWSVARSSLEIGFLAFRALSLNNAGLAAYYSFDEGTGTTVFDGTRATNDGSLLNFATRPWVEGEIWPVPALEQGIILTADPSAKGLWVGQITLGAVNEVGKAVNGASESVTPTGDAATIKILLHVDAAGRVRMLKDVMVMQTQPNPQDPNSKQLVLVTDPKRIREFNGIVNRGGKLVGLRQGTASYDFPGNDLPMLGGVGAGVGCIGAISLAADFPTNPFRHKYHPDHRSGLEIVREFSIQFDGTPGAPLPDSPSYGVQRLTGVYKETISGLHKIPLKTQGSISVSRINSVEVLNNGQF